MCWQIYFCLSGFKDFECMRESQPPPFCAEIQWQYFEDRAKGRHPQSFKVGSPKYPLSSREGIVYSAKEPTG